MAFLNPFSHEIVSQFVIPATFAHGEREPGSRKKAIA
jgi:hypothetical protein